MHYVNKDIRLVLDLGRLPFHVGVQFTPSNEGLPDCLPFRVGIRTGINLLVQMSDAKVSKHLSKAYAKGSMVGSPMSEDGIGRRYAEDFFRFICRNMKGQNQDGIRLLEIGCGSGYLLYRLQNAGLDVLGIEPGGQGQVGAHKYGIHIIQEAFPEGLDSSSEEFEMIVHYGVLEHIEEPVAFLKSQAEWLSESGLIIFAVPDCREYIMHGDISMFLHEHWNYFTPYSLKRAVEEAGLQLLRLENAGYGGSLYGVAGKSRRSIDVAEDLEWSVKFKDYVKESLEKMRVFFRKCMDAERSLGIFCPARAINILYLVWPESALRFFDDDKRLHGRFYPPFDIPVEPRETLIEKPVEELLIMSSSFGERLRGELLQAGAMKNTNIRLVNEIVDTNGR